MDFEIFPLPIIKLLTEIDEWSQGQKTGFIRNETRLKGYSWESTVAKHFSFKVYLKQASPKNENVFAYGTIGNPKDLITYDSNFHHSISQIHHPYTVELARFIDVLNSEYNNWLDRIEQYQTTTLFGAVNEKFYEDEFYSRHKIILEHNGNEPFSLDHQLKIETLVNKTIELLEPHQEANNDIKTIIEYGKDLKRDIPKYSRNQIIKRLAKFYAKIRPIGAQLSFEVLKHFTIEAVKYLT